METWRVELRAAGKSLEISRIQTKQIARKDEPLDVHGQHKTVYQKLKRNWKPKYKL